MIANPPPVFHLLRTWSRITSTFPASLHAEFLAALFRRVLRPDLTYDRFLDFYHLHLQQIPKETAAEAWGINHATAHLQTKPTK